MELRSKFFRTMELKDMTGMGKENANWPGWWRPHDGDPWLELMLKYLSEEDQITVIAQLMKNDIAMKEQTLKVQKMAVEMLKKGRSVE